MTGQTGQNENKLLNKKELAAYLNRTVRTIETMIKKGKLPIPVRIINRQREWRQSDIDNFFKPKQTET